MRGPYPQGSKTRTQGFTCSFSPAHPLPGRRRQTHGQLAYGDRMMLGVYLHHFNPYLNFHRPCAQPELYTDEKGRTRRRYLLYQTPWETLQKIPQTTHYLRKGMSLAILKRMAQALSDTDAAQRMQQAKQKLFQQLRSSA